MSAITTTKAKLNFDDGSTQQEIAHVRWNNGFSRTIGRAAATTGEMDVRVNRLRETRRSLLPSGDFIPTALEWASFLPLLFDGAASGSGTTGSPWVYTPGDSPVTRDIYYQEDPVSPGVVEKSATCALNVGSLHCNQNDSMLALSAQFVGKVFTASGATYPASPTAIDFTYSPFILPDASGTGNLTVNGSEVKAAMVTVNFAKNIRLDRFYNSLTLTDLVKLFRTTTITVGFPLGESRSLYADLKAGVAIDIKWYQGPAYLRLHAPSVAFAETPVDRAIQSEVEYQFTGECNKTASEPSIKGYLAIS